MSRASPGLSHAVRRALVLHGLVVILLGLLAGFPYALVVLGSLEGEVRAWRMAHLEGVLNGLVMIAVGASGGVIALSPSLQRWLQRGLLAAGYGNVIAATLGAASGHRGLTFAGPPLNLIVALLFTVAIVGVLGGLVLAASGAARSRGSDADPHS